MLPQSPCYRKGRTLALSYARTGACISPYAEGSSVQKIQLMRVSNSFAVPRLCHMTCSCISSVEFEISQAASDCQRSEPSSYAFPERSVLLGQNGKAVIHTKCRSPARPLRGAKLSVEQTLLSANPQHHPRQDVPSDFLEHPQSIAMICSLDLASRCFDKQHHLTLPER